MPVSLKFIMLRSVAVTASAAGKRQEVKWVFSTVLNWKNKWSSEGRQRAQVLTKMDVAELLIRLGQIRSVSTMETGKCTVSWSARLAELDRLTGTVVKATSNVDDDDGAAVVLPKTKSLKPPNATRPICQQTWGFPNGNLSEVLCQLANLAQGTL